MTKVLGIDLGTVNSCVAAVVDGKAIVLRDGEHRTIPSCVSYQQGKVVVGHAARRQAVTDPHNTISAVKRLLGHPYDSREVQQARERSAYPIRPGTGSSVVLEASGHELTPIQVSARILERLRTVAERSLGEPVESCVISVPAHFNDVQRKATKLAAEYAGLEVRRLINEPTAAAFAYGYKRGEDFTLAVYDLGGGTFDITVMRAEGDRFSVLATDGDSYLGGEDFDFAIAEWIRAYFEAQHGLDLRTDPPAWLRVKDAAERAKVELTDRETTEIELPFLTQLPDGSRPHFRRSLGRAQFEELAGPVIRRTLELCERCLREAGVSKGEIDDVLLVGGQSRMPAVRSAVRDFFGREARRDMNPDEVVALGAALYAYSISADELCVEAEDAAGDAYEIAIKSTDVARRIVREVEQLEAQAQTLDDAALRAKLEALLARTAPAPPARPAPAAELPAPEAPEPVFRPTPFFPPAPVVRPAPALRAAPVVPSPEDLPRPAPPRAPEAPASAEQPELPRERSFPGIAPRVPPHEERAPTRDEPAPGLDELLEETLLEEVDEDGTLPSLAGNFPAPHSGEADLPVPGHDPTPVERSLAPSEERPPVRAAERWREPEQTRYLEDEGGGEPRSDPSLPRARPDAEQLPIALAELNAQLEHLNQRAQDVIERLAAGLVGEESLDPDAEGKESPLSAARSLITEQLGSAQQATQSAQHSLDVAEEHRNARRVDLVDVTSHALGIGAALDLFTVLIPHNTPVPVERTRLFTTNQDGQSEVEIRVFQGRQRFASENQLLGSFILEGIPPAPRMSPKIQVTFSIDANGILSVRARDAETKREQSIRVEDPLGLQQVEPEQIVA